MSDEYDYLVVGAGGIGLSCAYHLLVREQSQKPKVLLIDKMIGAGRGNSSKSAGNFRFVHSSFLSYKLNADGAAFFEYLQEKIGYDVGLKSTGRLYLMSERTFSANKMALERLASIGLKLELFEGKSLEAVARNLELNLNLSNDKEAELMNLEDISTAVFCPKDGAFSPEKLCAFYESEIIARGGKIMYNTLVKSLLLEATKPLGINGEPFEWQDKQFGGVVTDQGKIIRAKNIIIATGVWSSKLLDPVGIDSHSKAKKRQIFVIKATTPELQKLLNTPGFNEFNTMPMIMLVTRSKLVVKPLKEENDFWILGADELGRPFEIEDDPKPESTYFQYSLQMPLKHYLPQFANAIPYTSWAGQYAYNTFDDQPFVKKVENLVITTGDSGMGLVASATLGKAVSAVVNEEEEIQLYNGETMKVSDLSLTPGLRKAEKETLMA